MKRFKDLMIVLAMYVVALAIGFFGGYYLPIESFMLKVFLMDVFATIIIWVFTLIKKNTSIYDPYWSFIPMLVSFYIFFTYKNYNPINIIYLIVFNIWGFRLTYNWCTVFYSFEYEDWRYSNYRNSLSKPLFHLVNFFGLQMIPTLVVFAGMIPMFIMFSSIEYSYFSLFGIAIILFGIAMEFFADRQMHSFLRENKEKVTCRKGLWKYSRHPNYLGEISIWVGTYITMLIALPSYWYYGFGMILMVCLFLFISIPLAENRQKKRRSDYMDYISRTSMLLLLPNKKSKDKSN